MTPKMGIFALKKQTNKQTSSLIDKIISYLKSTHGDLTHVYIGKDSPHLVS